MRTEIFEIKLMDVRIRCTHHEAKSYDNLYLRRQDLVNINHFEEEIADDGLNCGDVKGNAVLV